MADYAPQERTLYVAYTNTDLSEGRGRDVPIAVCELEVTAKRLAACRYAQGTDGPVRPVTMLRYQGKWLLCPQPRMTSLTKPIWLLGSKCWRGQERPA